MTVELRFADNTRMDYELPTPLPSVFKYPKLPAPRLTPPSVREQIFGSRLQDLYIIEVVFQLDCHSLGSDKPIYNERN